MILATDFIPLLDRLPRDGRAERAKQILLDPGTQALQERPSRPAVGELLDALKKRQVLIGRPGGPTVLGLAELIRDLTAFEGDTRLAAFQFSKESTTLQLFLSADEAELIGLLVIQKAPMD